MASQARRLILAWLALMALSAALAVFADVRHNHALSAPGVVAAVAVAGVKCRIVLAEYLDLRRSRAALRGFVAAVAVILLIVGGSFLTTSFHP